MTEREHQGMDNGDNRRRCIGYIELSKTDESNTTSDEMMMTNRWSDWWTSDCSQSVSNGSIRVYFIWAEMDVSELCRYISSDHDGWTLSGAILDAYDADTHTATTMMYNSNTGRLVESDTPRDVSDDEFSRRAYDRQSLMDAYLPMVNGISCVVTDFDDENESSKSNQQEMAL